MGLTFNDTEMRLLINRFNSNKEDKINILYENFCSEIFPYLSAHGNLRKDKAIIIIQAYLVLLQDYILKLCLKL